MKSHREALAARLSKAKATLQSSSEVLREATKAFKTTFTETYNAERELDQIKATVYDCMSRDLCSACRHFAADILSRNVWRSKTPISWKNVEPHTIRRVHKFPGWFKDDLRKGGCQLCRMLVQGWRQLESAKVSWSTIMYIDVLDEPSSEFRIVETEDLDEIQFEFCSDYRGSKWLEHWMSDPARVTLDRQKVESEDEDDEDQDGDNDDEDEQGLEKGKQSEVENESAESSSKSSAEIESAAQPKEDIRLPNNDVIGVGTDSPIESLGDDEEATTSTESGSDSSTSSSESTLSSNAAYRKLLDNSRSDEAMQIIKNWLTTCLSSHVECKRSASTLPTRVIDVGGNGAPPKLYISKGETEPYLCLSYCWGIKKSKVLTTRSLQAFQKQIPADAMPRTIEDAITVTRSLGIRYIWIDALCIIQDDNEDWLRESVSMAGIYAGARLTIAGSEAVNRNNGLFQDRCVRVTSKPLPCGSHMYVMRQNWSMELTDYHVLQHRAWTLQERIMSVALIHFSGMPLLWECRTLCTDEESNTEFAVHKQLKAFDMPRLKDLPESTFKRLWYHIVQDYADRKLTRETDRLAALAGLAEMCEINGWQSGRYLAGIWEGDLPANLLWCGSHWYCDEEIDEQKQRNLPTWSWSSTIMPNTVLWPQYFQEGLETHESVFDCALNPAFEPYLSTTSKAAVALHGRLYLLGHVQELTTSLLTQIWIRDFKESSDKSGLQEDPTSEVEEHELWQSFRKNSQIGWTGVINQRPSLDERPEIWFQAVIDRVFDKLNKPLHLMRVCSWQSRFQSETESNENYLDTFCLLMEPLHDRTNDDDDNDNDDDDDGALSEEQSAASENPNSIPTATESTSGNASQNSNDLSQLVFRRAGMLGYTHRKDDERIWDDIERSQIVLI